MEVTDWLPLSTNVVTVPVHPLPLQLTVDEPDATSPKLGFVQPLIVKTAKALIDPPVALQREVVHSTRTDGTGT
mgnify:CR=1 FL=1